MKDTPAFKVPLWLVNVTEHKLEVLTLLFSVVRIWEGQTMPTLLVPASDAVILEVCIHVGSYLSLMLSKHWMMYIGMTHWGGIDR